MKRKNDGNGTEERLSEFSELSAGGLVKVGTNCLGKDVVDIMIERRAEKEVLEKENLESLRSDWQKVLNTSSEFEQTEKPISLWMAKDHDAVLKALKRGEWEKIPNRKQQMVDLHEQWKDRVPSSANEIGTTTAQSIDEDAPGNGDSELESA